MLALKLGLSLPTTRPMGKWSPDDETSLEAWYENARGISLDGSAVSQWADSSGNSVDMEQANPARQPAYDVVTGVLTFVSADKEYLQSAGQVSLSGEFTIGVKMFPDSTATGTFLGDNTTSNEKFKIAASNKLSITIGGTLKNFSLDSGDWGDTYIVITRDGADLISLWYNGQLQADTETLTGTSLIDAISVRATNVDNFDGTISEIQIYSSSSAGLTANVNDRLSTL